MADISMCSGEHCPIKTKCYRFTAKPNPDWQSYTEHVYDTTNKKCEAFWDNSNRK